MNPGISSASSNVDAGHFKNKLRAISRDTASPTSRLVKISLFSFQKSVEICSNCGKVNVIAGNQDVANLLSKFKNGKRRNKNGMAAGAERAMR